MSDKTIRKGDLVMLVARDEAYTPPLGSCGEVVGSDETDFLVMFQNFPCPVPPGEYWFCLPWWLMKINTPAKDTETEREKEAV